MLQKIWLAQPLAFARAGTSPEPCDAFEWGPNDLTPAGTGRTTIRPVESLAVAEDGTVSIKPLSDTILFKDDNGAIKPVCPFFELHGCWDDGAGPVTNEVLARQGLCAGDLRWTVEFRNHKAFHWTRDPADKIEARVTMNGDDTTRKSLSGRPIANLDSTAIPLVPTGVSIPLGSVQLTKPNAVLPEFRLRFTPGGGHAYGPTNLAARIAALVSSDPVLDAMPLVGAMLKSNAAWQGFALPAERCMLDPAAAWSQYALFDLGSLPSRFLALVPEMVDVAARQGPEMQSELLRFIAGPGADLRNLPPGLFAWAVEPPKLMSSLGMVDDFGDGVISCAIDLPGSAETLTAQARIVSGPPAWAPDRRPVTSLADGLADRVDRASVRHRDFVAENPEETKAEMRDLLDRAYETVGLSNLDALNDYFGEENRLRGVRPESEYDEAAAKTHLWNGAALESALPLPLTATARDRHRRNTVDLFFNAYLVATAHFMKKHVREPAEAQRLYDRRMPGLMRGGDRRPLTLTRRQYDTLRAWVAHVRRDAGRAP